MTAQENLDLSVPLLEGEWAIRLTGSMLLTGEAGLYVSGEVSKAVSTVVDIDCSNSINAGNPVCADSWAVGVMEQTINSELQLASPRIPLFSN